MQDDLSKMSLDKIQNDYVAKVKPGAHSLILPLGARATLFFEHNELAHLKGEYKLELIDISGAVWTASIQK